MSFNRFFIPAIAIAFSNSAFAAEPTDKSKTIELNQKICGESINSPTTVKIEMAQVPNGLQHSAQTKLCNEGRYINPTIYSNSGVITCSNQATRKTAEFRFSPSGNRLRLIEHYAIEGIRDKTKDIYSSSPNVNDARLEALSQHCNL